MFVNLRQRFSKSGTQRVNYKTLEASEIRLLSLTKKSSVTSGNVFCRLKNVKLDSNPVFIALSYVWGSTDSKKQITVNGQKLFVTENLYAALLVIIDWQPMILESLNVPAPKLLLWIDAICINQDDLNEKSKQVPRIASIFSSAFTTLVWMHSTKKFDRPQLQIFMQTVTSLRNCRLNPDGQSESQIIRTMDMEDRKLVLDIYSEILGNPWFTRIWTTQEYLLSARQPHVWFQSMLFPLSWLHIMKIAFHREERATGVFQGWNILNDLRNLVTTRAEVRSKDYQSMSLGHQIIHLLQPTTGRKCLVPHDHIYGFLGMTNLTKLPTLLEPNYTLPYSQIFKEWTKYIIESTGNLSILSSWDNQLEGVPSWVLDWRYRLSIEPTPSKVASVSFSPDGSELTIHGLKIARVIGRLVRPDQPTRSCLRVFVETILTSAAWIRQQSLDDVFVEWMNSVVGSLDEVSNLYVRWRTAQSYIEHFEEIVGDLEDGEPESLMVGQVLAVLCSHYLCVLENGSVVHCNYPKGLQEGDESLWVVSGCDQAFILAHTSKGYLLRGNSISTEDGGWSRYFHQDSFSNDDVLEITLV